MYVKSLTTTADSFWPLKFQSKTLLISSSFIFDFSDSYWTTVYFETSHCSNIIRLLSVIPTTSYYSNRQAFEIISSFSPTSHRTHPAFGSKYISNNASLGLYIQKFVSNTVSYCILHCILTISVQPKHH